MKKGQFSSTEKNPVNIDLNLSIVSDEDDDFDCYHKYDYKLGIQTLRTKSDYIPQKSA